jgi:hypothetical protein
MHWEDVALLIANDDDVDDLDAYVDVLSALVGLNEDQTAAVVEMNDKSRLTFAEIADAVEGWFAQ